MERHAFLWAGVVALAACGGGSEPDSGPVGAWHMPLGGGCGFLLELEEGGAYSTIVLCPLDAAAWGAEVEEGTYAIDGAELVLMPERSSCADASAEPRDFTFNVTASQLTMRGAVGVFVFDTARDADRGEAGQIRFGCWGESDAFEQGSVDAI